MKTNKILVVLFTLMLSVTAATAQEVVGCKAERDMHLQDNLVPTKDYVYQPGDTIIISKEMEHYLTGEEPSTWVYYVRHLVHHQGGKRFPNGVLIDGIMSWVRPEDLNLAGSVNKTEEALQKEAADRQKVQQRSEEIANMDEQERKAIEAEAQKHNAELITPVEPKQEEPAQEVAQEEEPVVVEPEPQPAQEEEPEQKEEKAKKEQFNRFTIGLRGGTASLMHDAPALGNWKAGFDVLLDLQYAHYWTTEKQNAYGLIVGLGAGYSRSGLGNGVDSTYSVNTSDGQIDYSISAEDVNEKDGQIQLEVPVMFSMILENGIFFNVGPKLVVPVYAHYNQKVTDPHINAYFPEVGVTVTDEVITGMVQDNQMKTKGRWQASTIYVMLTAELGYEWRLKNNNSLGLGVYANYSVYDLYKNDPSNKSLIDVTAPSASGAAVVDVLSATDTYAKGMGYFDCGIKLAYHFNFFKKK